MSDAALVDTDVFSYIYKGDTRADLYARHLAGRRPHLAFATIAELYRWSRLSGWGQVRVDDLLDSIRQHGVLGWDDATGWNWARVMSIKGRPMAHGDAWVAAVALRHNMPLVTHNRKHFEGIPGLTIISES